MIPPIKWTEETPDGDEITHELPAVNVVCGDCEGEGVTLHEAIRQHAYTAEEFHEAFDEEEAAEYAKGGHGIYGVACKTCKGNKNLRVVDAERLKEQDPVLFERWNESEIARRRYEREARREREVEARMLGEHDG